MIPHRQLVTGAFFAASILLGIPSTVAFLYLAWGSIQLRYLNPGPQTPGSRTGNQLIDGLVAGGELVGKMFAFFGGAMEWVMLLMTILAFILIVIAAILFVTARGLHAGQAWARVAGVLIALLLLLVSVLMLSALRRPIPLALGSIGTAASCYVVWILGWRSV